jgi:hypothetical protein
MSDNTEQYYAARREYAALLRVQGYSTREIAARLGVSMEHARNMAARAARQPERVDLLAEVAALPPTAFIDPKQTAAYLGVTTGVLHCWREQRRGPRFFGSNQFARYRRVDIDEWMAKRSGEVDLQAIEDARTAAEIRACNSLDRRRQLTVIENETATT